MRYCFDNQSIVPRIVKEASRFPRTSQLGQNIFISERG